MSSLALRLKPLQVEHLGDRHLAEVHLALRRARVHVLDAVRSARRPSASSTRSVLLMKIWSAKPTWRRASCRVVELLVGVLGVDQRQDRVEQVALGDLVVHEEGLRHRAGVGQAGGLDHHAVEVELALALLLGQVGQRRAQVFADRAADAAVVQLDDLLLGVLRPGSRCRCSPRRTRSRSRRSSGRGPRSARA